MHCLSSDNIHHLLRRRIGCILLASVSHPEDLVSIVVAVQSGASSLSFFHRRLRASLATQRQAYELIYVHEGPCDETKETLDSIRSRDHRVAVVTLAVKHGRAAALRAGLHAAKGQAIVLTDTNILKPELIRSMLRARALGADIVTLRPSLQRRAWWQIKLNHLLDRHVRVLSAATIPNEASVSRLLSKRVAESLLAGQRHAEGPTPTFDWIKSASVTIDIDPTGQRQRASSTFARSLWHLAFSANSSRRKLRWAITLGYVAVSASVLCTTYFLVRSALHTAGSHEVPMLPISALSLVGLALAGAGALGEAVERWLDASGPPPPYFVTPRSTLGAGT